MKYLTTLQVAQRLGVSKQTLLNWLYASKVPEPPRNKKGHRLWSLSRLSHIEKLIADGRIRTRTVVHKAASARPDAIAEFAREINQFVRDAEIDPDVLLRELARLNPAFLPRRGSKARGGSGRS